MRFVGAQKCGAALPTGRFAAILADVGCKIRGKGTLMKSPSPRIVIWGASSADDIPDRASYSARRVRL